MFKNKILLFSLIFIGILSLFIYCSACKEDKPAEDDTAQTDKPKQRPGSVKVPRFVADSAYTYIEKQVSFGPRVPNTPPHKTTRDWLIQKLESFGATVIPQDFTAQAYTGETLKGTNIIAQFNPELKNRVILAAHWDTRHISDHDPDDANKDKPVPGADDGGSGVGILLEVARQIQSTPINLGVDIIYFDLEDYGQGGEEGALESWCLGSQHWSRNPHARGYRANFGILLDMAGAKNARFTKDGTSMQFAPNVMNKVWKLAQGMGYGNWFVDLKTKPFVDDHYFVNTIAGIPMIDIINRPDGTTSGFGHYWHTQKDDMSVIDKRTLRAVGQTLLAVIYRKSEGTFK